MQFAFDTGPIRGSELVHEWEQILASRPSNIKNQRLTIDDRADVYATGLILYKLTEGKHPFIGETFPAEAIFQGKPVPEISRLDISDGLKRVIMRMLDINQVNRPKAQVAAGYLEAREIIPHKLQNGGFYYTVINGVNRFLKMKNDTPNLFDGVIVEASQVPNKEEQRMQLRTGIKNILVDPQTYLFQYQKHQSKKFKKLPYFPHSELFENMPEFLEKTKSGDIEICKFIDEIVEYQNIAGVSAFVPPFLYIDEFNNDAWEIDQEISFLSLQQLKKQRSIKPIVKGVAISQEILTSEKSRNKLLEYLTSFGDEIEGYFVLLCSTHSEIISDEPWIKGARDLFTKLLSTGKYVIWNKADFAGLIFSQMGISIATGETGKQRRFNITEDIKSGPRRKVPFYYIPELFARTTWPDAIKAFSQYKHIDDFLCSEECCRAVQFSAPTKRPEADLATHMMHSIAKQFRKYKPGTEKNALIKEIKSAKQHYDAIKNHSSPIVQGGLIKSVKPSSGSFLDRWLNALNS